VLPVILFHAGFSVFSGGFVGVDVFFVISGYLITSILISEMENGNFSILKFYERRARRILPALFVVMLACIPFAWMWMLPEQFKDFSESIVAVIFFVSNILFWREEGYFAGPAELKPLLHTWSLAVEEQYYLLFPIFLLLFWRLGRNWLLAIIILLALGSLALSEWGWRNAPSPNFYLAPTRAWELLAGSICAFLTNGREQRSSNLLSLTGLALILFSIFQYDEYTPFPSVYALAPVGGSALIILFAGRRTLVARLLSTAPFVGIGLISYSAYLWHQPLFAFARLRSLTEPSVMLMAGLALASLALAWVTWLFIETPFRKKPFVLLSGKRALFATSGVTGIAFVCFGLSGILADGFKGRINENAMRYDEAVLGSPFASFPPDGCAFETRMNFKPPQHPIQKCAERNASELIDVMLIGDSHATMISGVLGPELRQKNIGYYKYRLLACPPLPGLVRYEGKVKSGIPCGAMNEDAFNYARDANISTIVLFGRFPFYLSGQGFDNGEGGAESDEKILVDAEGHAASSWNNPLRSQRVLDAYKKEIRQLAEHFNVVLVYPIPEAGWDVPGQVFKKAHLYNGNADLSTSYEVYLERAGPVIGLFDRLTDELPNVHAARVHEVLCSQSTGRCVNSDALGIYYYDDDHLSEFGARAVAPVVLGAIEAAVLQSRSLPAPSDVRTDE
jgi:peptidoglycan/LPS O-acetylase OafA/YrhL